MAAPVPAEFTVLDCRKCGRKIFFARTPKAANMPLEAHAVKVYRVRALTPGETQHHCEAVEEQTFLPHWGNCPGADELRAKGGG